MRTLLSILLILGFTISYAQETFTVNGVIKDASNNETLYGVNVLVANSNSGVVTNEYGFYSIKLPKGEHTLIISYLGFQEQTTTIELSKNTSLNFSLNETSEYLEEVVITEDIEKLNIRKPEMSVNKLDISTIQKLPVVFGEVDVIKSLLLLPGVSNAGEGSSGFNVRGGAVDQNLILLDEATIYNSSHLFGLFSVFNPDAIKNLKLYKGGIPAKYGGRVSSVLEIFQKDGNSKEFKANGGIGLISSRLLAEGPIVKDRSSFLIAGRGSYAHLFLKFTDNDNAAYFYDLNTKLSFRLDNDNSILFSGYFGRDVFNISESFKNTYGNAVFNLRWNHVLTDNIFTNLSVIYSDYYYGLTLDFVGFNWNSGIKNLNLKYDFNHNISDNLNLDYGIQNTYYEFNPGEIEPSSTSSGIIDFDLTKKYAFESAIYLSAEQKLTENVSAEYGFRFSNFFRLGQSELNRYQNDQAVNFNENFSIYEKADPIGSTTLSKNKVQEYFWALEPRVAIAYSLNDNESVKLSYNRMNQYLHLITNTSSPTPLDIWTPSGKYIEPQILDQVAAGYFRNISNNKYSIEVEGFYKFIQNRIDYIDGADLIANNAIEQVILPGTARAYGLELLVKKNLGRFTGWLAYTISRSEQKTPGRNSLETGINNSKWYKTAYDKTHDVSIIGSYDLNSKWQLNTNFVYQTGLPTTYPSAQYKFENLTIPVYADRNSARLPSLHRLDISATYTPIKNKGRNYKSSWNFGIYNVYGRKNAVSLNFRNNEDSGNNEAVRLSLFGIVPSVTYNFKF
ncbi:Outer membrane receptor proteins, mostly Fe transport [Gillisia sp. Hel1_33_143]|uniref:TonB-dependent receptor n=1 Tax=Gillisia sp. Hel1_33_143 TaxID=1336796 RepID=UPI00087C8B9A|nr:TonB-dependent receptor [Gillisia sp. Hel1_33_143]SDS85973.1 Outer membrane receptor proteins, mostly Fe transport [Gillisia sp. Hel1_33_143]